MTMKMKRRFGALIALAAAFMGLIPANAQPTPNPDPRSLTIYQIMVASFIHGPAGAPRYTAM